MAEWRLQRPPMAFDEGKAESAWTSIGADGRVECGMGEKSNRRGSVAGMGHEFETLRPILSRGCCLAFTYNNNNNNNRCNVALRSAAA
jgi:hypothetical protein